MAGGSVLLGVTSKVDRANEHIADADALVAAIIADLHADVPIADDDPQNREITDRVARNQIRLQLIIGDIVHNLASALDHLAWQLVPESARGSDTGFPIFRKSGLRNENHVRSLVQQKVNGASQAVTKAFRTLQPYEGGDHHLLWVLHNLDIIDKHRLLLTITRQIEIELTNSVGVTDSVGYTLTSPAGVVTQRSEQETPVDAVAGVKPDDDFQLSFDVLISEPGVIEGEPVRPTLRALFQATNDVIGNLSKFL